MKPIVILVEPQMGENIGAVARAMKNFGLSQLRIVNPRDGWPNEKAESTAASASDIIHDVQIYGTLLEAIEDIEYLYATTAQPRDMNKDYVLCENLHNDVPTNTNIGIMFGRERWGLNNEEISLADKIITINTSPSYSSLNIAQAVIIVAYELFKCQRENREDLRNAQILCTKEQLSHFFNHLESLLEKNSFFKLQQKQQTMMRNIKNIFTRIPKLSANELQTLRGILSAFEKGQK